jgi:hypothetical protein
MRLSELQRCLEEMRWRRKSYNSGALVGPWQTTTTTLISHFRILNLTLVGYIPVSATSIAPDPLRLRFTSVFGDSTNRDIVHIAAHNKPRTFCLQLCVVVRLSNGDVVSSVRV